MSVQQTPNNQHQTTVLVTGSNGQLGNCLRDLTNNQDNLNFIYTDFQELDITNLDDVQQFFTRNKINYCINCAAYTAVDKAESEPDLAYNINVLGAKNLAMACKANQGTLVHISTDFVFDGNTTTPYLEGDPTNPVSVYGKTKLEGELEIQDILTNYFIIRTSWLYSEHGNNFMKTMLKLAKERDELSVVNDQMGTPTYAGDLAQVIITIIKESKKTYGLYHFSNEGVVSWYDFAKAIFELSQTKVKLKPIPTKSYPTPAKRPPFSVLDKNKLKRHLEVQIFHWQESLKVCLNKYLN